MIKVVKVDQLSTRAWWRAASAARYALLLVAVGSGITVALRAMIGPFTFITRVNSPVNAAGFFGAALTLFLLMNRPESALRERTSRSLQVRATVLDILGLVALTAIAFWRAASFNFLSDDFIIVKQARDFRFSELSALLTTGGGDGFFRPVGQVNLALNYAFVGLRPALWHISALMLHAVNSVLLFFLALRLWSSRMSALFAAALFVIHGTRPEAAVWIAGRFDLLATFFVLLGLLLYARSWDECVPAVFAYRLGSLGCMVVAVLSKESAYVFPLLLLLLLASTGCVAIARPRDLVPFFVAVCLLLAYRWALFDGIGGYHGLSGKPQALTFGWPTLNALLRRLWAALYFPINWSVGLRLPIVLATVLYIGSLFVLMTSQVRRRDLLFPLGFVVLSALPPLHLLGIGENLQGARVLYLPSVGFSLMVAVVARGLRGRAMGAVMCTVLAFNFIALQHNLSAWEDVSSRAKRVCDAAKQCTDVKTGTVAVFGLPGAIRGVPFFANGFPECLEITMPRPTAAENRFGEEPVSKNADKAVLRWDTKAEELRCVPVNSTPP